MKKQITFRVEAEKYDYVMAKLKDAGMTFSGYLRGATEELYETLKSAEVEKRDPQDPTEMDAPATLEMMARMMRKMKSK